MLVAQLRQRPRKLHNLEASGPAQATTTKAPKAHHHCPEASASMECYVKPLTSGEGSVVFVVA